MSGNVSPVSARRSEGKEGGDKPGWLMSLLREKLSNSSPSPKVWSGKTVNDVPNKQLVQLEERMVCAFSAPTELMTHMESQLNERKQSKEEERINIAGKTRWDQRPDEAYGILLSLYDRDKNRDCTVGDPVADCLSIVVRPNNSILALADGVSWGEKPKLAAWSAVYGCTAYLLQHVHRATTTRDVFVCLMSAFQNAQTCIIEEDGTLTTLCAAVVVQLKEKRQWGLCVVNVGDSLAYVYNKSMGVREVTTGSHPLDVVRDMKNAGGALGPVDGLNPDLANLTCSFTVIENGDIVFLTSDGISDNFDPVVAFFTPSENCQQRFNPQLRKGSAFGNEIKLQAERFISKARSSSFNESLQRPMSISPLARHCGALEKMTEVIEDPANSICCKTTAISVCVSFQNFAVQNTQRKREIHEEKGAEELRHLTAVERQQHDDEYRSKLDSVPGKLDHASIAALEVGYYAVKPTLPQNRCLVKHLETATIPIEDSYLENGSASLPKSPSSSSDNKQSCHLPEHTLTTDGYHSIDKHPILE